MICCKSWYEINGSNIRISKNSMLYKEEIVCSESMWSEMMIRVDEDFIVARELLYSSSLVTT